MIFPKIKYLLIAIFVLLMSCFYSQNQNTGMFDLDGVVYGYNYNPTTKGIFKKEKQIVLEGTLSDVQIIVTENKQSILKTLTNKKGEFKFKLKLGTVYLLSMSKANHNARSLIIDLRNIPQAYYAAGIGFDAMELILNSFPHKDTTNMNLPIGRLYFNAKGPAMEFEEIFPTNKKNVEIRKKENTTPVNFIRKSVEKNKGGISLGGTVQVKKSVSKTTLPEVDTVRVDSTPAPPKILRVKPLEKMPVNLNFESLTEDDISKKELELTDIRRQLELDKRNAVSHEDSLAFMEKEKILEAATLELNNAKKLIAVQKQEIQVQKQMLFWALLSIAFILSFLGLVIKYYLDKKKSNKILSEKNRRITESINYAKRIQHAILIRDEEIRQILPDSFIFFRPLNIVSGDFYWISKHGEKVVVAAIDCTGHGVPGAFMSLICNSILYETIMDKKILDPAEILARLNTGIINLLRQDTEESDSMDGMELSLCVIDHKNARLEFAGAMNPGFVVKDGKVEVLEADVQTIGGMNYFLEKSKDARFTTSTLNLEKGMNLYLLSDGFTDQFGGPDNKKFNIKRFKQLLLDIQGLSMNEQKEAIDKALQEWMGTNDQLDDILIMGMRF